MSFMRGHVLGRHVLHRAGQLVDVLLHELLTQPFGQLGESLLRVGRYEVVLFETLHLTRKILREHVELEVPFIRGLPGQLGTTRITRGEVVPQPLVDRLSFLFDDLAQFFGDLVVNPSEIEAVEGLLAALLQLFQDLAHALNTLSVTVLEALLEHPAQGGIDVAVVQQIVGELTHHVERVELESPLGSVPG